MITTYAAPITLETIPALIADAAKFNLNVDYLDSVLDEAQSFDVKTVYAILSVNHGLTPKQATFTEMWDADFENCWKPNGMTHGKHWKVVTLINPR